MCTRLCRTCLLEIISNGYVDINRSEFTRKQLTLCIPELNLDLVAEPVLCLKCVEALNAAYDFKSCCLQTEQRIQAHVQTLTIEQQNVELDAVLGNNGNGINLMAKHCDNDITKDLNTLHDHSRTRLDSEDYKDVKGECFATSENCSFDDGVEVNYDSIKEESITIEEHKWDISVKSEMFDSGSDAEISCNLRQWSDFENRLNLEWQDCNRSSQKQDVDSSEQFEGLLRQYNKWDPANYNANVGNCNSSTISSESSTEHGSCATKSQVGADSRSPNNSTSSVGLLRQLKETVTKIADTSNIYPIKRGFKNTSSIKSHSSINKRCKRANRRALDRSRCHQKEKNNAEQIVAKSGQHSELPQDGRVVLTKMDISSAEDLLNVDNCAVMKGVETQVKKSSLKCDVNIKSNNTAATEADADLHSVIDRSQLHPRHSNASALNNSNTFTNISFQHFINSNNLSVPVKCVQSDNTCSRKGNLINCMKNHAEEKPYKCNLCGYACSARSNLIKHLRKHTGEKPYKCDQCDYASSTKSNLIKHLSNHTGEKPYKCHQCDNTFSSKYNLISHMRKHTGEKPFKCDQCDYAYSHKISLTTHMTKHTGEKQYKCDQCDYACFRKSSLIIHMKTHTGEKPYKCDQCDYACSIKGSLIIHIKTHTGEKPYKCDQCDYACSTKGSLITHIKTHTGEKPYKCHLCDYTCSTKTRLIIHMRKHTGEKPYKCEQCDYACSRKHSLIIHMRTHTGEKPYKCDQCDYACSTKCNLIIHMRMHTGENSYKCSQCDHAYPRKDKLIIHMRTHTGEKPYKCDQCDYACTTKGNLIIHMRKHTGEKPYKCDQCGYACSVKSNLMEHLRKHTGEKPYKCDQCDYAFSHKISLITHMKKHTGEKP